MNESRSPLFTKLNETPGEQWFHLNEKYTPRTAYFTQKKVAVATEIQFLKEIFENISITPDTSFLNTHLLCMAQYVGIYPHSCIIKGSWRNYST